MSRRLILPIIGILIVLGVILIPMLNRHTAEQSDTRLEPVTIGIQTSPAMAVVMVAEDEGFFDREGVNVELKQFSAGKFALQAMMGNSIDIAVAGEVPVGLAIMQGNDVRVYAQAVRKTTNEVRLVARAREGQDPRAFFTERKHRLATSLGGGPEFFTWSYLKDLGVPVEAVEIIGQKPEDMPAALTSGSVDAIAVFDPFAFIAEKQGAGSVYTFPDRGVYSELYVLAAKPSIGDAKQEEIKAIMRALRAAEIAIAKDPTRAKAIVQRYTGLEPSVLDGIWDTFDFAPAITPQLLDYWNRQYDWARETGKIDLGMTRPDYAGAIDRRAFDSLGKTPARP